MFGYFRRKRRARWRAEPFPEAWREIVRAHTPLYGWLPPGRQRELEGHTRVLLEEKRFEGCAGLVLTDEIRLTIASHAAILMLGHEPHYFPRLISILVYPRSYRAVEVDWREHGLGAEVGEERLGESWVEGVVVVSWDDARCGAVDPRDGDNVLLHEFAHQLDQEDGTADGVPYLESREAYDEWRSIMQREFERLQERPQEGALDDYGAEGPDEFFAVATEAFFERPHDVLELHPELYGILSRYFRLDPAAIVPEYFS